MFGSATYDLNNKREYEAFKDIINNDITKEIIDVYYKKDNNHNIAYVFYKNKNSNKLY